MIEEKEDDEDDINLGLTTYSNSESTVLSSASIFENLWAQSTIPSAKAVLPTQVDNNENNDIVSDY